MSEGRSPEDMDKLCEKIVKQIRQQERRRLSALYQRPLEELRESERDELIRYTIELPLIAQRTVKEAFQEAGISYIHLKWQKISEKLPSIAYRYIDWEQLDKPPKKSVKKKTFIRGNTKNVKKERTVSQNEKPWKSKIEAFKDRLRGEPSEEAFNKRDYSSEREERLISAMRERNYRNLNNWCSKLQELIRKEAE